MVIGEQERVRLRADILAAQHPRPFKTKNNTQNTVTVRF